jgi:ribosomal protein S18 acetylase RimI-like enzyme
MCPAQGIVVRPLGVPDAPRYRTLRLESLRHFQFAHGPDYAQALEEQPLAWHEERLAKDGDYWFGAFDGDELVGAITLRTQDGRRLRHSASLNSLVVDRTRQGRGIGKMLVSHLIAFARSLGTIRQITLALSDGNTSAERLYDAFGFKQFGLEPDAFLHEGKYYARQHRQLILRSTDQHE